MKEKKTICPECGGTGGKVREEHDFEICDVCLGEGAWEEEKNEQIAESVTEDVRDMISKW